MNTPAATEESKTVISDDWVDRYLALLKAERTSPSLDALAKLARSQFHTIPFENVTSLLRRCANRDRPAPPVDFDQLLVNWESGRGGGVCYEIATMFHRLLVGLRYDARPVLAQISSPDGHQAIVVAIDDVKYLVDVGTGSPVFAPLPLGQTTEFEQAGLRFRVRPTDEQGFLQQERLIDGNWLPSCRYDLSLQTEERREAAFQRHHTFGESWVVDSLRMVKWDENRCYSVTGNELTTITPAGKEVETLTNLAGYQRMAANFFGLPNFPIAEAMALRPNFAPFTG